MVLQRCNALPISEEIAKLKEWDGFFLQLEQECLNKTKADDEVVMNQNAYDDSDIAVVDTYKFKKVKASFKLYGYLCKLMEEVVYSEYN